MRIARAVTSTTEDRMILEHKPCAFSSSARCGQISMICESREDNITVLMCCWDVTMDTSTSEPKLKVAGRARVDQHGNQILLVFRTTRESPGSMFVILLGRERKSLL